jgi:hypothetical protein
MDPLGFSRPIKFATPPLPWQTCSRVTWRAASIYKPLLSDVADRTTTGMSDHRVNQARANSGWCPLLGHRPVGISLWLVLLATAHVAAPITHFIAFEVGDLIDRL